MKRGAVFDDSVTPLEVMLRVMRGDTSISEAQFRAAVALAPYVHARPAEVAASTEEHERVRQATARAALNSSADPP